MHEKNIIQFLHITDTHLLDTPADDVRGFNTHQSLQALITQIKADKPNFDFIIVSGDISQTNSKKSYQLFSTTINQLQKPVYCIPGNHDDPKLLHQFFPNTPINTITSIEHNQYLLVFINTQVIDQQHGFINQNDLAGISQLLERNKKLNAIIILHHPPITINSEWMDNIGLKNGNMFMQAMQQHENLKLILFGHVHQEIEAMHKHIRLFATPSSCYQFTPNTKIMQYDNLSPAYRHVKINQAGIIQSQVHRL